MQSSESITSIGPNPKAWWEEEVKTTPWWYETPHLLKPIQHQAWYLPEVKAPPLQYLNTAPVITLGPMAWIGIALGLTGLVASLFED